MSNKAGCDDAEHPKTASIFRQNWKLIAKLALGFFADAYDLFVIDLVLAMLQKLDDPFGEIGVTDSKKSLIVSATSGGAVLGMILFGLLGDLVGRRASILVTGFLVAVGSILSGCVQRSSSFTLATQLILARIILGVGVGGEYPLSATMASESVDNIKIKGKIVCGVFSMQGVGMLTSTVLTLILLGSGVSLDISWRILLIAGALPAVTALWFRLKMNESHEYSQRISSENSSTTNRVKTSLRALRKYVVPLIGTMSAWFLVDVTFYGTGQFKHSVSDGLFSTAGKSGSAAVMQEAWFSFSVAAMSIPGYVFSCVFIDKIGRWRLQVGGFVTLALFYVLMAISVGLKASAYLNVVIFGITFFFTNFGPNVTTFLIPSEIFPVIVRTTCHGASAAMGKAGALLGAAAFTPLNDEIGVDGILYICGGVACLGAIVTVLFLSRSLVDRSLDNVLPDGVKYKKTVN